MTKKLPLLFALTLILQINSWAQIVTIPSLNPQGTGSTASPYRKPLGSNRSYERSAMIYKQSEIGTNGIIQSVAFFVDSLNTPGNSITRIFIKEVPDTIMATTTVAAVETGATLVYDDTIFAAEFVDSTWVVVNLTTPFVHSGNSNLMVITEVNSGGVNGTDINTISKGFRYFTTSGNAFQYWQSTAGSGTIPAGNGILSLNRPNIQLSFIPLPSCTTPPVAGTTVVNNDSVCNGDLVNLSLSGADIGTGISYQWISGNNGINWNILAGDTNSTLNLSINSDLYVACIVTCSGVSDTSSIQFIHLNSFYECYCNDLLGGNCTSAIDSVSISGTTLLNGGTGCTQTYTQYPGIANTTATLQLGQPYTISCVFTGDARSSLWIDLNQNGVFDLNEWTQISTTSVAGATVNAGFIVPAGALTGITGMRVRSRSAAGQNDSTSACATFGTGETEDYLIEIVTAPPCTLPPSAGIASSNVLSVCSGDNVQLSISGNSGGSGISFNWLSSNDGINWTNIAGANQLSYNTTVTSDSYFALVANCSGTEDTSNVVHITLNPFYDCYCTDNLGGNCATTAIDSVSINGTTLANGPTGCSATFYTQYPATGNTTADLQQGLSYNVVTRYNGVANSSMWIDYNQNGVFESAEWTQLTVGSVAGVDVSTSVTIPLNALSGLTGMRIRSRATTGLNDSTVACDQFGSGETEDYIINILPAPPCVTPPVAGTVSASVDTVCAGDIVNFSLNGTSIGTGISFQWIQSSDAQIWNPLIGEVSQSLNATLIDSAYFACIVTCSGISDTSNFVFIALNSYLDCYCTDNLGGNCTTTAIDSVAISGTSLANGLTGCSATFYTAYPDTGNTTAILQIGQTYSLITRYNGAANSSVWIDFNHNGQYEISEWTQITAASVNGIDVTTSLQIPINALTGPTGMRVRSRATNGLNDATVACSNFGSGETEDYIVQIIPALPCTTPPDAGTVINSSDTICPNEPLSFTLSGVIFGTGQTYQWIASNDGLSWIELAGDTGLVLNTIAGLFTQYTCVVTCSGSQDTSSYTPVFINNFIDCYCTQGLGGNCAVSAIDSISIVGTGLDNGPTGCAATFYTLYTDSVNFTASLAAGDSYTFVTRYNGDVRSSVWIDYDQSGSFDLTEWTQLCTTSIADSLVYTTITIPFNATPGLTGMRIRSRVSAGVNDSTSACVNFGTGETEDYRVTILPGAVQTNNLATGRLLVYPNPSDGIINIENANGISQLRIFDLTGRTVNAKIISWLSGSKVIVALENKGCYFVEIMQPNGQKQTQKLINK